MSVALQLTALPVQELGFLPGCALTFDPTALLAGLSAEGTLRLSRLLFEFCRSTFQLQADPRFVDAAHRFAAALPAPRSTLTCVDVTGTHALVAGYLPQGLGAPRTILVVGPNSVAQPAVPALASAANADPAQFLLLIDRRALPGKFSILLLGEQDIAVLAVPHPGIPLRLNTWLERNTLAAAAFRRYLASGIAATLATQAEGLAALREFQLMHPLPPVALREPDQQVGGEIELAVNTEAGLFLAGWLNDPNSLIAGLHVLSPFGTAFPSTILIHRYPREDVAKLYPATPRGSAATPFGFVAFLPGFTEPAPVLQYRVSLTLRSGASLELVPRVLAVEEAQGRDTIMQIIPPRYLTKDLLLQTIAPPAASLHRAFMAARKPPGIVAYGVPIVQPEISIIVPVYRNIEFLRGQHAALAFDPETRAAELIYVLDSPEQRPAFERMLRGLYATYAMPCRLLVMSGNYGFAAACNAGATLATGRLLLPLNSDVVPAMRGWLGPLVGAIDASKRIGAVGAKLLYDDDSLQHAGLYFAQDADGAWHNHHFHKGYPRDYPEANRARLVPGVTGAAMLLRRDAFQEVGGFTEDYIIGDYEDSDLCLKLRNAGFDIWYEPAAELYHFERRSMPLNGAYWRSNVSEYNRLLHENLWHGVMAWLAEAKLEHSVDQVVVPARRRRRASSDLKLLDSGASQTLAVKAR